MRDAACGTDAGSDRATVALGAPHASAAPLFSVITVCYNAEATLEATLESVLSQSCPHVEYIVIDGASTDGTKAIIERYKTRLAHVVSEPDEGLYYAMDKGIRLATGRYLCFLNAGDTFHETDTLRQATDKLEQYIKERTQPGQNTEQNLKERELRPLSIPDRLWPDVIYGETALVDGNRRFLRMRRLSAPDKLTWKSFKQGMLVCHQAFWPKRGLAVPYDHRYRYSADFDWCVRILKRAATTLNTRLVLVDYLAEGMTTRHHKRSLWERFRIMTRHYGWCGTLLHHLWFAFRWVVKR
ncbi:MAG: glycosyltransferase [Prevotellaceae bacterium]|nr:glycosyltransferase [Prevotellaceae bacterium]